MVCTGLVGGVPCTARLHGRRCAQIPRGFAELGVFRCPACLIRKLDPQAVEPFPEGAVKAAETKMAIDLTTGAEATGKGFHDYKALELEFLGSLGFLSSTLTLPSDDKDVFMMFLSWLVAERKRALSLDTICFFLR